MVSRDVLIVTQNGKYVDPLSVVMPVVSQASGGDEEIGKITKFADSDAYFIK